MAKLLLTGASGLVGSHIAELFAHEGIPFKCLVRPQSDVSFLKQLQAETVEGDITSISSVQNALDGVDCVIHAAGKASDWGRYRDFYTANVVGTMNVLRACKEAGIANIIITGSISSYGEEDSQVIKNEDSPHKSHYPYFLDGLFPSAMNYYRDSKALLSQRAAHYAAEHKLNLSILEPAWVYGEREFNSGFFEYVKAVESGLRYAPGSKRNLFHVIYAPDLAQAYLRAYRKQLPGVHRIIIASPKAHRLNDIHSLFCRAAGLPPPKLLPKFLVYPIGLGMELLATLLSRKEPPLLTRSRVNMMYDNIAFSGERARQLLGWEATTALEDGIRQSVDWYTQNGLLKKRQRRHQMSRHKLHGVHKELFILKVKLQVFYHFLRVYLQDHRLRTFIFTLRRLNYFIGKISHNKFAQIGPYIRLDMYVPGFPSKAFYTACHKFTEFKGKLPCTVALLSVTSACTYHCEHCYQRLDHGKDVELDKLISAAKYLQNSGVAFFNIEGGEPFLTFDRLLALCRAIDDRSEIWINSTGYGITKEKLLQLKSTSLSVIMFSLHTHDEGTLNAFMGDAHAWQNMVNAIELCHQLDIAVAFNACLPLADFRNGNFEKLMQKAHDLGGILVQIIKPKPSGAWLGKGVEEYSARDFELIKAKVNRYNLRPEFAHFPAISAQIMEEDPNLFGCTAGGTDRLYINAKGDVQPCEFLNVSFGNIASEDFAIIYQRMRAVFEIPQTCICCERYAQDIYQLYHDNHLQKLPLPPELSSQIFAKMRRDCPTPLYQKIERLLK
ncbi:MAG TPA: NAD-dependent epimerase/dehydratase family protein [Candidatus Cloacimonadota bacterium]|nr:NAD-dependent epimerase/dehydratase family protein [Candidatus Cloacimonadota bacterium]